MLAEKNAADNISLPTYIFRKLDSENYTDEKKDMHLVITR